MALYNNKNQNEMYSIKNNKNRMIEEIKMYQHKNQKRNIIFKTNV